MRYKLTLTIGEIKQALEVISGTFKNLKVWNVILAGGQKAVLFKIGSSWLQRNEDTLDNRLLHAIGEQIDKIGSAQPHTFLGT